MDTQTATPAIPIGRIDTDPVAAPNDPQTPPAALPTLNPADSPYQALNLPTVEPKQVPVQEQQPVQNLGAVNHAGALAYMADQILRGAMQGYDIHQQKTAEQFNKKLSAQQQVYNDQASQLYKMAQAGVDPNSQEFKDAYNRTLTSWQAVMQTVGQRIPQPKKSAKSKQGQSTDTDQTSLLQRVLGHKDNPQDALQAVYQGAIQTGPPVFHQIKPFLSPQYQANQRQTAQTQQTAAAAQQSSASATQSANELAAKKTKLESDLLDAENAGDTAKANQIRQSLSDLQEATSPYHHPSSAELSHESYVAALSAGQVPKDDQGVPRSEDWWIANQKKGGAAAAAPLGTSEWARGLEAYAKDNKLDPQAWTTIRAYDQDRYSAKNPLADRRLALAERNSDIASASLALRQSANDFNDMEKIFKQLGPDTKIQATAQASDDYTKHPTGPGDVAMTLAFFEVAKAADPGSGSGIRFTQQEQKLIQSARGWADAAQANVERWGKGTLYDDSQRAIMARIIKDAAKRSNEATASYLGAAAKLNPRAAAAATGGTTTPENHPNRVPSAASSPQTHVFDSKAWKAANPNGDVNAAIAAAKAQGYEVR